MPKISVIVPVYRVEKYLAECVDSILAQTYADFELILVDDGSPDNCGAICDAYADKDSRIRVIHQENQGLSGARNSGIDVAQGEYITFIDSDDLVSTNYLEILHSEIVRNKADISCCKMRAFQGEEFPCSTSKPADKTSAQLFPGRESVLSIYRGTGQVSICACGKLYRKCLFGNIRFPLRKLHEDQAIVPILLYEANCVASIDAANYYYRNRSDSITHKAFKANRFDNVEAIDSCILFFRKHKDKELVTEVKRIRRKVNAILVILAKSEGADNEIPQVYRMSKVKAIYYLFKYAPDDTYSWYLSRLYPRGIRIHAYALKIRRMLRRISGSIMYV